MNTLTTSAITSINAATAPGAGGGDDVFSYIENLASNTQSTIGSILVVVGIIVLHRADASGADSIAVAPIPDHGIGTAIIDRLTRAAAPRDATA